MFWRLRIPHFEKRWKWPRILWILIALEFAGTVSGLALFGIASPNLFRTRLWQIGYENGFNSDPRQILYAYANYEPLPKIPLVWSQTLTDFNVAVSVLSMFILLVKVSMFLLHVWYPILSTVVNAALTAMWIVSMYGQMGPDHNDPAHKSNIAWYISKSCDYAEASGGKNKHYCLLAKGTFATTVFMAAIFFFNMLLGVWSLIPTAAQRANDKIPIDDMQSKDSPSSDKASDKEWELKPVPKFTAATPMQPYTPRTLAFNTLDRQLPLRDNEGRWA